MQLKWRLLLLFGAIVLLIGSAYAFNINELLTFETLKHHRKTLVGFVNEHPFLAPLTYIAIYIVTAALCIPEGFFMSMLAGFLFPQPLATLYPLISCTVAAIIIYVVAKSAFGGSLKTKAGSRIDTLKKGFEENPIQYMFFLRFIPMIPFWLINITAALFDMPLFLFTWTTFVGLIPVTFAFSQTGAGLGTLFDHHDALSLDALFNHQMRLAFALLAGLALLALLLRKR